MFNTTNEALIEEFIRLYRHRPMLKNVGGLSAESSHWLWRTLKELVEIQHVVESGVWRGQSTWLIAHTRPDVTIDCLDPITCLYPAEASIRDPKVTATSIMPESMYQWCLEDQAEKWWAYYGPQPRVQYIPGDILQSDMRLPNALVILDDHQDVLPRLKRCVAMGVTHVILDDQHISSSDFNTVWAYKNPQNKNVNIAQNLVAEFATFETSHIVECWEYPHIDHAYFEPFERHQHLTYLRLR